MTQQPERRVNVPPTLRGAAPVSPSPNASRAKSGGKNKKVANGLVALSSAAILSIYGLGYVRSDVSQASNNLDAPVISIATTAPMATAAPSSPVAAYQSPLFLPTPVAATSTAASSVQNQATATAVPSTATTASAATTAAKAPAAATSAPATTALSKDGTYSGTGTSRHGNITASVFVQGGKIVSAAITQCGTRYPCSDIAALPGQVVARQGATVDVVSGATDSSQAYRGAIQNALAKAKGAA